MIKLRVGVSTRVLFDLEKENQLFYEKGLQEYIKYNIENTDTVLQPGPAFRIVRNLLALNEYEDIKVEIVLMSRACPEIATRVLRSLDKYKLEVNEAFFTGGDSLSKYVENADLDLYMSATKEDVKVVLEKGIPAGYIEPNSTNYSDDTKGLRIAFDCDRVLFNDESDRVYEEQGLEKFQQIEKAKANIPIGNGPFKKLLVKLGKIQERYGCNDTNPIKIAICTARDYQVHERCIKTISSWGIRVSQAFFLNGNNKAIALKAFNADIFFDDSESNVSNASKVVPACQVVY